MIIKKYDADGAAPCGFPLSRYPAFHTGIAVQRFPAFDGRCQTAYIPLATAKLTLSPLIPNPSPKIFRSSPHFQASPRLPHNNPPEMPCHQPVGMRPGASAFLQD